MEMMIGAALGIVIAVPVVMRYGEDLVSLADRIPGAVRFEIWLHRTFSKKAAHDQDPESDGLEF